MKMIVYVSKKDLEDFKKEKISIRELIKVSFRSAYKFDGVLYHIPVEIIIPDEE